MTDTAQQDGGAAYLLATIDGGATCYCCKEEIPETATDWGFTWGSDGVWPDGASAMYACWNCRDQWIDPPEKGPDQ